MRVKCFFGIILAYHIFNFEQRVYSQTINESCPISRKIGAEKICLPILSGMQECLLDTNVINFLDIITLKGKRNIAFYIDDVNKHTSGRIENYPIDNYLYVFSTEELEDTTINQEFISLMYSIITSNYKNYLNDIWDDVKERMKENIQNISLDQPVLIDHYLIDKKIPCIITLIRSNNKINEKVYLTATVIREFNGKFLSYAWYMNYDGENSIRLLKLKIDYFSLLLKQLNNENIEITGILDIKVESNLYSAMEYFNSAYDRSNEGKYNEAIQLYSKAIELYPIIERIKMSEAYFNRGLNRRLINDLSGAISDYSEAILIKPDYYKAYYNRGIAKMKKQDFIGAIADFTFVINSENSDKKITASSYGNRGFSKYSIGQYSCSDLKKASELGHETYKSYLAKCE